MSSMRDDLRRSRPAGRWHPKSGSAETIYKRRPDDEKWQVRTPDNRVYGPVPKSELDQWVAEGRVPAGGVAAE